MRLVRYEPQGLIPWFRPLSRLLDFGPDFWPLEERWADRTWVPAADMYEEKDQYVIKADLPEVDQKDLNLQVGKGRLTLKAERKFEHEEKRGRFHSVERRFGNFARTFDLPANADAEKISANYDKGVVTVRIPKLEEARSKPIQVQAGTN